MKKFYMTIVAMLCSVAASAQTCTISAEDVTATAGGETAYLVVNLNESDPGKLVTGAGFVFKLPAGVTVAQYYDEDEEGYVDDVKYPNAKSKHVTKCIQSETDASTYAVGIGADGATTSSYFKTSTNELIVVGLAVPAGFQQGDYLIKFSQIGFSAPDPAGGTAALSVYPQEDFNVKLVVGGTGINGINAIDSKAPIYNVAGQRVSKAQKGVFIQNGKKVAVK